MITQNNARKAEKALKEILDKADSNLNGKVGLEEFIQIIEINGVEVKLFPIHFCNTNWTKSLKSRESQPDIEKPIIIRSNVRFN